MNLREPQESTAGFVEAVESARLLPLRPPTPPDGNPRRRLRWEKHVKEWRW